MLVHGWKCTCYATNRICAKQHAERHWFWHCATFSFVQCSSGKACFSLLYVDPWKLSVIHMFCCVRLFVCALVWSADCLQWISPAAEAAVGCKKPVSCQSFGFLVSTTEDEDTTIKTKHETGKKKKEISSCRFFLVMPAIEESRLSYLPFLFLPQMHVFF